jgi:hypothetical protein
MSAAQPTSEQKRPRRGIVLGLIVLGSIVGFLAIFSLWVARSVLETDTWTENSTKLLEDDEIREPVSAFVVEEVFADVDIEAELQQRLPPQFQGIAGPASGALRQLADEAANEALQRPRVQQLWADANEAAHTAFVDLVEGGGERVQTEGGGVTLDLGTIVEQIAAQVGVDVSGKIPPDAGQLEVLGEGELSTVQDIFNALRPLAIVLTLAMLLLYALAVYLARGWRRQALRAVGFAFIITGVLVLVVRGVAGDYLTQSLTETAAGEGAVSGVWEIYTSLLRASAWSVVGYGVIIILGAWLAGPGQTARSIRRDLAALLRGRALAYALLGTILLIVFWWNPTPGTARLLSSLLLVVLAVAGMEALRHQAIKDFPDETTESAAARWRKRLGRGSPGGGTS